MFLVLFCIFRGNCAIRVNLSVRNRKGASAFLSFSIMRVSLLKMNLPCFSSRERGAGMILYMF